MAEVTVAKAISFKRAQKGMSARRLSTLCGLSPSYINKVEKGVIEPSFRIFCKMAEVLEMSDVEILFLVRKLK